MVDHLRHAGFDPEWTRVDTEAAYLAHLDPAPDVILADYSLPQWDAPSALRILHERHLDVPLIVISGTIGEETAAALIKQGAADFLLKDRLARFGQAVGQALELKQLREESQRADAALQASETRYRRLFEAAKDGILILDAETGQIVDVNSRSRLATKFAGCSACMQTSPISSTNQKSSCSTKLPGHLSLKRITRRMPGIIWGKLPSHL